MNHNFLVFTNGVPVGIHAHKTPIFENFYVYTPPERDEPYFFKSGDNTEAIYAILFKMTEQDRSNTQNYSPYSDRVPQRLKPTIAVLDMIFANPSDDYSALFHKVHTLLVDDILLVTECGVRGRTALSFKDSAFKGNAVIAMHGDIPATQLFMNIVKTNIDSNRQSQTKAFDNACKTGIFGDYYNAITPRWWTKAHEKYGTEVTRRLPKNTD